MSEKNRIVISKCPINESWTMFCPVCKKIVAYGRYALVTINDASEITGAITDDLGFPHHERICPASKPLIGPMMSSDWKENLKITFDYLSQFAKEVEIIPFTNVPVYWNTNPIYVPIKNIVLEKTVRNVQVPA